MGVYTQVSTDGLDADSYTLGAEKLYPTGSNLLNFPVAAPFYFDIHVNDTGTSVTQAVRTDAAGQILFSRAGSHDPETGVVTWRSGWQGTVPLAPGSGLGYNSEGTLGFDPTGWNDEVTEEVTRRIRVPFWLVQNTTFHVRGSDGIDAAERDGKSSEQAWKTIQFALNQIATNYNLDRYNVTLNIENGIYNEDITLPYYNRTTGIISIAGDNITLQGGVAFAGQGVGRYNLRGITIEYAGRTSPGSINWYGIFALEGTYVSISEVTIDMKTGTGEIPKACIRSQGNISIGRNCIFKGDGDQFWFSEGGTISLNYDCMCEGNVSRVVSVSKQGSFSVTTTANNGARPVISGNVTGRRYSLVNFSVVNTAEGGINYFPGTIAGTSINSIYDGKISIPGVTPE